MFESLGNRLQTVFDSLKRRGKLTEEDVDKAMREVRLALLEADVALPVVKDFIGEIKARAMGQEVMNSLTPGQALIKIVNDELVKAMGEANDGLNLAATPPAVRSVRRPMTPSRS